MSLASLGNLYPFNFDVCGGIKAKKKPLSPCLKCEIGLKSALARALGLGKMAYFYPADPYPDCGLIPPYSDGQGI